MSRIGDWRSRVSEVGSAFLGVVRAEIDAVVRDLGDSGRQLVRVLVVAAVAAAVGFWALGLTLYLAIELLALVQPRWRAVLFVWLAFVIATAVAALLARARAKRIESPAAILRRRSEETRRWWSEQIAGEDDEEDEG